MDWDSISAVTNINLDLFLELVEFCIDSSYFRFRNTIYIQTFGTAMGSPLSPILADIVMEALLKTVVARMPFNIPFIRKYVDDLILALPKDQLEYALDMFNSYNHHLQFTKEDESYNKLPFLDTIIERHADQSVSTRWYSKPIASGRLLNFHSFHPMSMKINVATNFIQRVLKLNTGQQTSQQKHTIFQQLRQNNYPASLINRLINRTVTTITPNTNNSSPTILTAPQSSSPTIVQQQPTIYRSLPYLPGMSTSITNILKKDYPQVKITNKPVKTVQSLLRPVKDKIESLDQSKIIYSVPCCQCPATYIGMSSNQLKKRLSGHQSLINKYHKLSNQNTTLSEITENTHPQNQPPKTPPTTTTALIQSADQSYIRDQLAQLAKITALMQHTIEKKHSFDLTQTKILDRSYRTSALAMLEMCHISNTETAINHRTDVDGLNSTYAGVLHAIKTNSRRIDSKTN